MPDDSSLVEILDQAGNVFSLARQLGWEFSRERQGGGVVTPDWSRHRENFDEFRKLLLVVRRPMLQPPAGFASVAEQLVKAWDTAEKIWREVGGGGDGYIDGAAFIDYAIEFPNLNSIAIDGAAAIVAARETLRSTNAFPHSNDAAGSDVENQALTLLDRFPTTPAGHVGFLEFVRDDIHQAAEAKRHQFALSYSNDTIKSMLNGRDRLCAEARKRIVTLTNLACDTIRAVDVVLRRDLTIGTVERFDELLQPAVQSLRDVFESSRSALLKVKASQAEPASSPFGTTPSPEMPQPHDAIPARQQSAFHAARERAQRAAEQERSYEVAKQQEKKRRLPLLTTWKQIYETVPRPELGASRIAITPEDWRPFAEAIVAFCDLARVAGLEQMLCAVECEGDPETIAHGLVVEGFKSNAAGLADMLALTPVASGWLIWFNNELSARWLPWPITFPTTPQNYEPATLTTAATLGDLEDAIQSGASNEELNQRFGDSWLFVHAAICDKRVASNPKTQFNEVLRPRVLLLRRADGNRDGWETIRKMALTDVIELLDRTPALAPPATLRNAVFPYSADKAIWRIIDEQTNAPAKNERGEILDRGGIDNPLLADAEAKRINAQRGVQPSSMVKEFFSHTLAGQSQLSRVPVNRSAKRFRIALSFAGEKRKFVAEIAKILANRFGKKSVLYDKYHEAEFARPNLSLYLPALYNAQSELIVVILCHDYEKKEWPGLEWSAIHDVIRKRNYERVMLCRFDRADGQGLYGAGFVDLDEMTPIEAAELIFERLAQNDDTPASRSDAERDSPMLEITQDAIERLIADGEQEATEEYHAGFEAGHAWAQNTARRGELRRMSTYISNFDSRFDWWDFDYPGLSAPATDNFVFAVWPARKFDRDAPDEFWEQALGDQVHRVQNAAFFHGFGDGADKVWCKVEKQN